MTRKDVKGDQPSGGETTWTNTGATRYGRGQHKTGSFGDGMLRPSPNHGTQRLPNDDDDDEASKANHAECGDRTHNPRVLWMYHFYFSLCKMLIVKAV